MTEFYRRYRSSSATSIHRHQPLGAAEIGSLIAEEIRARTMRLPVGVEHLPSRRGADMGRVAEGRSLHPRPRRGRKSKSARTLTRTRRDEAGSPRRRAASARSFAFASSRICALGHQVALRKSIPRRPRKRASPLRLTGRRRSATCAPSRASASWSVDERIV